MFDSSPLVASDWQLSSYSDLFVRWTFISVISLLKQTLFPRPGMVAVPAGGKKSPERRWQQ